MIKKALLCFILTVQLFSCSNNYHIGNTEAKIDETKFLEFAVNSFKESQKTGTAEARNIKVDTVLIISSRKAEMIKAGGFQRDYKSFCKVDNIPYSLEVEQDSVSSWLKRAAKLPDSDTVGFRVKFKLDYVINGKLNPEIWIKAFDKNYKSCDDFDGPLLDSEDFLLDDLD